jgi:hypothetical protein
MPEYLHKPNNRLQMLWRLSNSFYTDWNILIQFSYVDVSKFRLQYNRSFSIERWCIDSQDTA